MINFNFPNFSRFLWSVAILNSQYNKINYAFEAFKIVDEVLSISEMTIFRISLMQYYNIVYILFAFSIKLIVMRILKPITTYNNHGTHINDK